MTYLKKNSSKHKSDKPCRIVPSPYLPGGDMTSEKSVSLGMIAERDTMVIKSVLKRKENLKTIPSPQYQDEVVAKSAVEPPISVTSDDIGDHDDNEYHKHSIRSARPLQMVCSHALNELFVESDTEPLMNITVVEVPEALTISNGIQLEADSSTQEGAHAV